VSEAVSLHEKLTQAFRDYLGNNGGGIADGFIYAIRYVNSDGKVMNELGCMDGQSTMLSAGLSQYLGTVVAAWVNDELFGEDDDDE
jgi:hypothetical protein